MRLYRVVPYLPEAGVGQPGHPRYVNREAQGQGRADNPGHYLVLYAAEEPEGAVGETFGNLATWSVHMFGYPALPGASRALVTLEAGKLALLNLDDPQVLLDLGLRPTDVVRRNRDRTQEIALRIFLEEKWDGIRWWSYWRAAWGIVAVWRPPDDLDPFTDLEIADIEPLSLEHEAVALAAAQLRRPIT